MSASDEEMQEEKDLNKENEDEDDSDSDSDSSDSDDEQKTVVDDGKIDRLEVKVSYYHSQHLKC